MAIGHNVIVLLLDSRLEHRTGLAFVPIDYYKWSAINEPRFMKDNHGGGPTRGEVLRQALVSLDQRMIELLEQMEELTTTMSANATRKDWYSTGEVAELTGVIRYTVQERWCHQGRIVCEKDYCTGKWRIPGHENDRLRRGGRPAGIG